MPVGGLAGRNIDDQRAVKCSDVGRTCSHDPVTRGIIPQVYLSDGCHDCMASSEETDSQRGDEEESGPRTETPDDGVARCIVCPLQMSERKREYLRGAIDEWQAIAKEATDRLYSFRPWDWDTNNSQVYEIAKQWPDRSLNAAVAREATYKPTEAFSSWHDNGQPGDPPVGEFGEAEYLRIGQQEIKLVEHDRGYGARLSIIAYDREWFGLNTAEYHDEWLARVCDEDDPTRHGSAEVHLAADGSAALHLTVVSQPVIVIEEDIKRWVGVDLGRNALYTTACVDVETGAIDGVIVESGDEYHHHRRRLQEKRDELGRKGDLRGLKACKGDLDNYIDWVLHTASNEIVELAAERDACGIRLEDLTDYREDADDAFHDWAYDQFQTNIEYKAETAGVPVRYIDPYGSSQICNRCGEWRGRDGDTFYCGSCDYEVHADVNAAIRIAQGNPDAR